MRHPPVTAPSELCVKQAIALADRGLRECRRTLRDGNHREMSDKLYEVGIRIIRVSRRMRISSEGGTP